MHSSNECTYAKRVHSCQLHTWTCLGADISLLDALLDDHFVALSACLNRMKPSTVHQGRLSFDNLCRVLCGDMENTKQASDIETPKVSLLFWRDGVKFRIVWWDHIHIQYWIITWQYLINNMIPIFPQEELLVNFPSSFSTSTRRTITYLRKCAPCSTPLSRWRQTSPVRVLEWSSLKKRS